MTPTPPATKPPQKAQDEIPPPSPPIKVLPSIEEWLAGKGIAVEAAKKGLAELNARFNGAIPENILQQWLSTTFADVSIMALLKDCAAAWSHTTQTGKGVVGHSGSELV